MQRPAFLTRARGRILVLFSGDPAGAPAWVQALETGDDAGYFGPDSAVWEVHSGIPTVVAGVRALLMQTLHPGAMAGVHDHSRYREDPLGRLSGTVRWVLTTTFADTEQARAGCAWVSHLHDRVSGTYATSTGEERPYAAGDADLPRSRAELDAAIASFLPVLRRDDRVDDAVRWLRNPPLGRGIGPAYRILFAGAVASLPDRYRRLLGLRRPWWPALTATRILLFGMRALLGPESSSRAYTRRRLDRLGLA